MNLKNILVIDLETVSATKSYSELDERFQLLWKKKALSLKNPDSLSVEELYFQKGGIYSEFGRIIVIGCGIYTQAEDGTTQLRTKCFSGDNEKEVLSNFLELINSKFNPGELRFCAHNGKEFDLPYLCRRIIINGLPLPQALQLNHKKPWEINHIDTLEYWKFGDYKNFTSLDLLAAVLDIPSSKDGIDGSMVNDYYHNRKELKKIAEYCAKDVVVTAQLLLRFNGLPIIPQDQIFYL